MRDFGKLLAVALLALTSCSVAESEPDELSRMEAQEFAGALMPAVTGSLPELAIPVRQGQRTSMDYTVTVPCPGGGSAEAEYVVELTPGALACRAPPGREDRQDE